MASLFVIQGRDQGKRFELTREAQVVGRDHTADIFVRDSEVSRRHAEFRLAPEGSTVVDLQSSNGTWVNGQRVQRHELRTGDRVQVGRTLLLFTAGEEFTSSALDGIDIVPARSDSPSRIVRSMSHEEGSRLFAFDADASSPWLARARSNLQIMYRTALAVSHTLDIDELLQRILDLIFEWVRADRGCIMIVDQETQELTPAVRKDRNSKAAQEKLTISHTILDYVMQRKEGVLTSDAAEDTRWDQAQSIVRNGVREAICVPMQGRYGIVGVIYIDTYTPPGNLPTPRSQQFAEEHLKLMVAIGHQAALAVEDTSYYSAMVQAERLAAMGQTIATLSHHIKNILQGIRGGSFLIQDGLKKDDNQAIKAGWRIVEKNQEKISNLVMDMLAFSKDRQPEPAPNDWNELVGDCVELMHARAKDAAVELQFVPATGIPELLFDSDLLHRAILNVITNAIDACEKRDEACVQVSTAYQAEPAVVRVMVADNGEGIAPDDIQRIFSLFESRKGARGTGLGLPVSRKILREHGGDIAVESTLGQGSRFILEIPAMLANAYPIRETLATPGTNPGV